MTARPVAMQFPGHGCMDDPRHKLIFDSQATCFIDVLGLFFKNVIHECFYNQTLADDRRMVQELNVCTVRKSMQ